MKDITNVFKMSVLFPVLISMLVMLIITPILCSKNFAISYGNNQYLLNAGFMWPVPGYTYITSPFGRRSSPTKGASSYHQGIDIAAAQGSNVHAITSGTVIFAGWSSGGGYMIIIEHDNHFDSRYCHLGEKILVNKGQKVYAGQVIATVGPKYVSGGRLNGATTGVHLHLGIRKNGNFVNPLQFFNI